MRFWIFKVLLWFVMWSCCAKGAQGASSAIQSGDAIKGSFRLQYFHEENYFLEKK